jgi:enoyl-[acyl-carrier-protein] reductase (NADH)
MHAASVASACVQENRETDPGSSAEIRPALSPGFTDTDLLPDRDRAVAAGMSPFGRIGEPAEVAAVAAFLASDEARWVTGENVGAGGGVF